METSSLALEFLDDRDSMLSHQPIAAVYVQTSTRRAGGSTHDLVSADCVSVTELEYEVNRLKGELDSILKEGRQRFEGERHSRLAATVRT